MKVSHKSELKPFKTKLAAVLCSPKNTMGVAQVGHDSTPKGEGMQQHTRRKREEISRQVKGKKVEPPRGGRGKTAPPRKEEDGMQHHEKERRGTKNRAGLEPA